MSSFICRVSFFVLALIFNLKSQEIRIVTEEAPPLNYTESGQIKGVSTKVVKALFDELGKEMPKVGVYPWARAFSIAQEKENVMIYSITRIPEREKKFKWIGTIAPVKVNIYKLKRRSDIKVEKLEDAKKYLVGVARNDSKHQYLERKGFKINASEIVVKDELNLKKLTAERIDLVPFEEMRLVHVCKKTAGLNIEDFEKVLELPEISLEVSIAFSKNTPDSVVEKFDSALSKLKKNGTHAKILRNYLEHQE